MAVKESNLVVVCPVCREMVHTYNGYILKHGIKYHGKEDLCAGSETPYSLTIEGCCSL